MGRRKEEEASVLVERVEWPEKTLSLDINSVRKKRGKTTTRAKFSHKIIFCKFNI